MTGIACKMMMESGVLRPGDREVRWGAGGVPLHATRQDLLNHAVEVLFGPALTPDQEKMIKVGSQPPQLDEPTSSRSASSRFSLKTILIGLGLVEKTTDAAPELPAPQLLVARLETQVQQLEWRLKTEQALCLAQREQLTKLGAQVNRIHALEADLAVERESGSRLAHWLQEAEQELASLRRYKSG